MPKWSDSVYLISGEAETNDNGFIVPNSEQKRQVFCNKKSVGYAEFTKTAQVGYKADLKLELRLADYENEILFEFDGTRYKLLRTYESKNGEFIELTLTETNEEVTAEEAGGEVNG
jgi:hypothetical protein